MKVIMDKKKIVIEAEHDERLFVTELIDNKEIHIMSKEIK